ncbi:MAG: hypothetical protein K6F69_10120 [Treponema sp.]|nr:hypothetical protein [Treponema sp.]
MSKIFAWIMLIVAVILIMWGLSLFNAWRASKARQKIEAKKLKEENKKLLVTCPICNSPLRKGENIISRVYRPMNVPEQYCSISGCPHCFPICEPGLERKCPVCGKEIPMKGYLIAHLFNYKNGKRHVLVTGCSEEAVFKHIDIKK